MITRRLEVGERLWIIRHRLLVPPNVQRCIVTDRRSAGNVGNVDVLTTCDGNQRVYTDRRWLFDDWGEAAAACERLNKGEQP